MMGSLRNFAGGWIAKAFLAVLIVSFGIWGIADVFHGFGERDLATIGSVKVTTEAFRRMYQDRLQQLSRQVGRGITPEQARALRLDRQILGEIVSETVLDDKARTLRLALDDEAMAQHIHEIPAFRGPDGRFNPQRFAELLRSNGLTEARFVDNERRLMLRQQIGRSLGGDIAAPAVLREAVRRYENEERSIEFVALGRKDAGAVPAPTPAEIATFFEERKAAFRAPEYRKLTFLALTPEMLAAKIAVPDADLRKAYEDRRDKFSTPEHREVEQMVFPAMDEAKAAAERLSKGVKFETIVAERGLKAADIALGLVAKRDILDPAVAEVVFALPQGKISEPVAGRFGAVLVRVNRIEPGQERSFAEVADGLRKDLTLDRAKRESLDLRDKIEDERASGSTVSEVAKKLELKVDRIEAVDRSGRAPDGKPVENVPALEQVLAGAFASQVGIETDLIEIRASGSIVWYDVTGITPSRERTIEEARERVEARWRDEETAKRLEARAEAIRSRLEAGDRIEAAAPGLRVEKREQLKRGRAAEGIDAGVLARMFETATGKSANVVAGDGVGRVVFRVTSVNVPAAAGADAKSAAALGAGLQDDMIVQYVLKLESDLGVQVNEAALRSIIGGDAGN
ncbi:MAG: SurA N-terminal domain-containing protein [Xanthobacteraceae bacterium]|nr:SurA N-terminal domain-containing protein [Xanthobacteraceae bacterium]